MGIIPGGGATQYLSQRMMWGRALDVIPCGDLIDAAKKAIPPVDLNESIQIEHEVWAGLFVLPAAEKQIRGGMWASLKRKS